MRKSIVTRKTRETEIELKLNLDGTGQLDIQTGVGFFDHMLNALCRFGMLDLKLRCQGDLHVDAHHTVEDCGLALGQALYLALGEKRGIRRLAHAYVPMDEALAFCAVDFSGRPFFHFDARIPGVRVGDMDAELLKEFLRAFATEARMTLHMQIPYGENAHHMLEAAFKALGRAVDDAKAMDGRHDEIPSTKGVL